MKIDVMLPVACTPCWFASTAQTLNEISIRPPSSPIQSKQSLMHQPIRLAHSTAP
jgi:hypothetical protein